MSLCKLSNKKILNTFSDRFLPRYPYTHRTNPKQNRKQHQQRHTRAIFQRKKNFNERFNYSNFYLPKNEKKNKNKREKEIFSVGVYITQTHTHTDIRNMHSILPLLNTNLFFFCFYPSIHPSIHRSIHCILFHFNSIGPK